MPYRLLSLDIECDTVEEVRAILAPQANWPKPAKMDAKAGSRTATSKSWEEARVYAKEKGISVSQARSELKTSKSEKKGAAP